MNTSDKAVQQAFIEESERLFGSYYLKTQDFRHKCAENENFWRPDHWHSKPQKPGEPYPSVPALFSAIENLHAEIMDNFPEAMILPRGTNDKSYSNALAALVNTTLDRCNFTSKYRKEILRLLKNGVCCFGVLWDSSLYGGYGDVNVVPMDMRNILWDTAHDNIQDGDNLFRFSYHSTNSFAQRYPHHFKQITEAEPSPHIPLKYDDSNILVIERWYKRYDPATDRTAVHMARIAGSQLLEWSELDPATASTGVYADGAYPFIVIPLYEQEDTPIGMGMIDVFKSEQEHIDILERAILKNTVMSGKLRLLKDNRCNIPKEKLADWDEDVLEGSDISERSIRWFQPASISPMAREHLTFKIDMLKRDSGQTDLARGENNNITAASAILALQSAAIKRTRNVVGRIYDKYVEMVEMMISRFTQFYDETRVINVTGENGIKTEYFSPRYSQNSLYDLDIKVKAHKKNPYEVMYNNEIAQMLHANGIIGAEEMLDIMSFEGKEAIQNRLAAKNNTQKEN